METHGVVFGMLLRFQMQTRAMEITYPGIAELAVPCCRGAEELQTYNQIIKHLALLKL